MAGLTDLSEFFKLSATLNYQLGAVGVGNRNILSIIMGKNLIRPEEEEILLDVLSYLEKAYGDHRRRLGPLAVLHPLRATAILARTLGRASMLDLLTELLHDKLEDIVPDNFPEEKYGPGYWEELEREFERLLKRVDPTDSWYLMERVDFLTRRAEADTYYAYIGRLIDKSRNTTEVVRVKLADRLDNTLDLRLDLYDPLEQVDFFSLMFKVLFLPEYIPPRPQFKHPAVTPINGAQRLYQLFKNTVLLSLIRQKEAIYDDTAQRLLEALAEASIKEAQRIVFHLFVYHLPDLEAQRALLIETMDYTQAGGTSGITRSGKHRLDGLILERFDHSDSKERKKKLDQLYAEKEIMAEAALAFIVVFQSFLNDPEYYMKGISDEGIQPL